MNTVNEFCWRNVNELYGIYCAGAGVFIRKKKSNRAIAIHATVRFVWENNKGIMVISVSADVRFYVEKIIML